MNRTIAGLSLVRGGKCWNVPIQAVRRVIPAPEVTPVPSAPPALVGLMAWQGEVLEVFEPELGLQQEPNGPRRIPIAVVVGTRKEAFALVADRLLEHESHAYGAALEPETFYATAQQTLSEKLQEAPHP